MLKIKNYEFKWKEHKPQQDPRHCYISVKHMPCTVSYGQHHALAFLFWNISFLLPLFHFLHLQDDSPLLELITR